MVVALADDDRQAPLRGLDRARESDDPGADDRYVEAANGHEGQQNRAVPATCQYKFTPRLHQ
jgi:hypothetical protein